MISHMINRIRSNQIDQTRYQNNSGKKFDVQDDPNFPRVTNVVSSAHVGCQLELEHIRQNIRIHLLEKNPSPHKVVLKISEPKATAVLYRSGKMVCMGAKNEEVAENAVRRVVQLLKDIGYEAKFLNFRIHNIVATWEHEYAIRLEGIVLTYGESSSYEPELFPGLIYKMTSPKVKLLIFCSKKVVLTGAKTRDDIKIAFEKLCVDLQRFNV